MKLGDNMTTEACNGWSDVTQRKFRPPRIGDIPRRRAIDQPSPFSEISPRHIQDSPDTEQVSTNASDSSNVPTDSIQSNQEVRKDSALYLEEESLKATADNVVRRLSSGYESTRGSFDDNRPWTTVSISSGGNCVQVLERQKQKETLLINNIGLTSGGFVEINTDEQYSDVNILGKRMPTIEYIETTYRKMSSSSLDMSNIQDGKDVKQESIKQENIECDRQITSCFENFKLMSIKDLSRNRHKTEDRETQERETWQKRDKELLESSGNNDETAVNKITDLSEIRETQKLDCNKSTAACINSDTNFAITNDTNVKAVTANVDITCSKMDTRKLSLPGEPGPSQRSASNVTDRPIYPRYPYSPYGSPQGSPRSYNKTLNRERSVGSSMFVDSQSDGQHLNQYKVLDEIGKGSFGFVKKVYNEDNGRYYAMKILSKRKLMKKAGIFGRMAPRRTSVDPLANVYKEIAILRKLDHPNVVKLVEVLDHPDKDNLYLVFELVHRGEILVIPTNNPLQEETARRYFRDVVLGVEYLHYQNIVHRDIKPSNLLVDKNDRIKIADLGVSTQLREPGELLTGQAGTPAFAAPETTLPSNYYFGPPCDVWSMGVTLYALIIGDLPWSGADAATIYEIIRCKPLVFPQEHQVSSKLRHLIEQMLDKSPEKRIKISGIKQHSWLTNDATEPLPSEADNCRIPVTVTDEEVIKLGTLVLIKTMLKQHSFQNPFLSKRLGRTTGNNVESAGTENSGASFSFQRNAMRGVKAQRFHERSNSAPDSYDWHSSRQVSVETPLPPVTEASSQESDVEKR